MQHISGVESGLRLTLNIEQYEYMAGPHDAAGVKILLHDPEELPSVHGLGQAIAPGAHGFVGAKFMMVNYPCRGYRWERAYMKTVLVCLNYERFKKV